MSRGPQGKKENCAVPLEQLKRFPRSLFLRNGCQSMKNIIQPRTSRGRFLIALGTTALSACAGTSSGLVPTFRKSQCFEVTVGGGGCGGTGGGGLPANLSGLTLSQIQALTTTQIYGLTGSQIGTLTNKQLPVF